MRKSIKIAPGIRMNISNKGIGVSVGVKGLRYSVNSSGRKTVTASIPGTGISYSQSVGSSRYKPYKSSSYKKRQQLESSYEKIRAKEEGVERARLEVEMFENTLDMIKSIHIECDDQVDWEEVKRRPTPLDNQGRGSNESNVLMEIEQYKPSVIDKLFKKSEKKLKELQLRLTSAKKLDQEEFARWQKMISTADRICKGDIEAYLEVIEDFAPLDDLLDFGSGFEFFIDNPDLVEVEFEVNSEQVVPKQIKMLTKSGKVSTKVMPKGRFYDIQQDYICSCSLRIARDMFALLPLNEVIINATDSRLNTETGLYENITILSVQIDKATLNTLNIELVDPSDSMNNFKHNMKFKKTKGFEEVERIALV